MRIGIDIDDVITNSNEQVSKYFNKYGKDLFDLNEIKRNMPAIMRGKFVSEEISAFTRKYSPKIIQNVKVRDNALKVLNNLKDKGVEIYLITNRGDKNWPSEEKLTKQYLKENKVPYDKVIFNAFDKYQTLLKYNIKVMIDDSVELCEELIQKNISAIVFTTPINRDIKTNVLRANNWLDLQEKLNKYY